MKTSDAARIATAQFSVFTDKPVLRGHLWDKEKVAL
jgi:hypothetical protein